jgi:hypothetical protein
MRQRFPGFKLPNLTIAETPAKFLEAVEAARVDRILNGALAARPETTFVDAEPGA